MTKTELEKLLRQAKFKRHSGGKHDIWVKENFPPIPDPQRHIEKHFKSS